MLSPIRTRSAGPSLVVTAFGLCTAHGLGQTVLVQLPPDVPAPAYLTRWHPRPFGNPALAAELGLDRWYLSASGQAPENAERVEQDFGGGIASFPDDPLFGQQWALNNPATGSDVNGLQAFLLAQELWDAAVIPVPSRLAIVDSAMFVPTLPWTADIPIHEFWTVVYQVPYPYGGTCDHALHVASIAASRGNNAVAMAGLDWTAEILAVQVLNGCFGQQEAGADGIIWATDHGARVINMSLQYGGTPLTVMASAVQYAAAQDVLVVAASGNYGWTEQTAVPSVLPEVIAVGALDEQGMRPSWSNAGPVSRSGRARRWPARTWPAPHPSSARCTRSSRRRPCATCWRPPPPTWERPGATTTSVMGA